VLRATLEAVRPSVLVELTPSFPGLPMSPVIVHVAASSFAPITSLALEIDGQSLALDSHGRATYVPQTPGRFEIAASAVDGDGLVGSTTAAIKVRDPNDV